jgi:hypothetical protein
MIGMFPIAFRPYDAKKSPFFEEKWFMAYHGDEDLCENLMWLKDEISLRSYWEPKRPQVRKSLEPQKNII